jgi:hypothetical protein
MEPTALAQQNALGAALAAMLAPHLQARTKTVPSSTPTQYYAHGPGGLFSAPALERPLFSAMPLPRQGLLSRLPLRENRFANPLYGIITGQTVTTGSEPTGPCDDPPVTGLLKLCTQTAYFGRQSRQTRVFELDRMGLLQDRGEHLDLQWVGSPFAAGGGSEIGAGSPTVPGMGVDRALNSEVGKALMEFAVAWSRDFAYEVFNGNPTNNTANGGRKYYRGLDLLINTGYRDAFTGQACPAADSLVLTLSDANISTSNAAQVLITRNIVGSYRYVQTRAADAGLTPVKWAFVMHPDLFYAITEFWPCQYSTYRCTSVFSTSQPQFTDTRDLLTMRDEMRGNMYEYTGQYLLIDGQRVEVILDSSVPYTSIGAGVFESSLYLVPFTVVGGASVLDMEYLPYVGERSAMEAAAAFGVASFYQTSDNGRFLWHFKPPTNFCVQFLAKTEPRLILRTPYLAMRMTDIRYQPTVIAPSWDPSGPSYIDGGRTDYINAGGPSYYTPTS